MSRYIDADAFLKSVKQKAYPQSGSVNESERKISLFGIMEILTAMPSADVVEVVHGKWISSRFKTLQEDGWCECSVCGVGNKLYDRGVRKSDVPYIDGKPYELKNIANYCPNCGADMRGGGISDKANKAVEYMAKTQS